MTEWTPHSVVFIQGTNLVPVITKWSIKRSFRKYCTYDIEYICEDELFQYFGQPYPAIIKFDVRKLSGPVKLVSNGSK